MFALKRASNSLQLAPVVWDGAVAQIQRADKAELTAGEYEVTVTGLTDEALVGKVTIAARTATSLDITSERVNPKANQALGYVVKDQYGENMTVAAANLTVTAFNTTNNTTRAVKGTFNNFDFSATQVGDVIKITAYLTSNPAVKDVKDITVSNIGLGSLSLGEPVLPTGAVRLETGLAGVKIPVTAADNYGNDMKLAAESWTSGTPTADGLIPTFTGLTSVAVNADGHLVVTLGVPGTAKLTLTNPATGDVIVKEIVVVAKPAVATITLSQPKDIVRVGSPPVEIPFELKDQYGEKITPTTLDNTVVNLTSTNSAVAKVDWIAKKIVVTPLATGTTTIFANVLTPFSTGSDTLTIEVKVALVATAISLNGVPTTVLATGQTVPANVEKGGLSFKVVDQDGKAINLAANKTAGVKANLTVTDANSVLTAPAATVLDAAVMTTVGTINAMAVTAAADKTGTATVKVQLFDDKNSNDKMDAGEALSSEVTVVYTVSASKIDQGKFSAITGTMNATGSAAYAAPNAEQTLTYMILDQAGNEFKPTTATNVVWTVTNTGATAITVNDGVEVKTLAKGATGTYTTQAAVNASTATLKITSADANKVEVSAAAQGVATPAELDLYFYDVLVDATASTYTGTVVAFDKTADWAILSTSVGNVVVPYVGIGTPAYTVDGNTATVDAFEKALTLGDSLKVTTDGANAVYDLTNK